MKKSIVIRTNVFIFLLLALVPTIISVAILRSAPTIPAAASPVTSVKGSAYGSFANISLFGGPNETRGPAPSVTLPPAGGSISASAPTSYAQFAPATIFSSGPVTVTTQGSTGMGSVTSSANIQNVNTSGVEVFTADNVSSTCSAFGNGISGSATITNGTLQIDNGDDATGDQHFPVFVTVPTNPAPNSAPISGHIHVNGSLDYFTYRFNEQVVNPDGSLTIYAAHQRLIGPTAVGDLYIGKVVCGLGTPLRITSIVRLTNGHIFLQGIGVPNAQHTIQSSTTPNAADFGFRASVTANAAGVVQFEDGIVSLPTRFYRLTFP
ncbi:MAG: hypothetical protein ACR2HH_10565 [Chthoniobacterales bacterium]